MVNNGPFLATVTTIILYIPIYLSLINLSWTGKLKIIYSFLQIFFPPLKNIFIPGFLNCWLAKRTLENMFVSSKNGSTIVLLFAAQSTCVMNSSYHDPNSLIDSCTIVPIAEWFAQSYAAIPIGIVTSSHDTFSHTTMPHIYQVCISARWHVHYSLTWSVLVQTAIIPESSSSFVLGKLFHFIPVTLLFPIELVVVGNYEREEGMNCSRTRWRKENH